MRHYSTRNVMFFAGIAVSVVFAFVTATFFTGTMTSLLRQRENNQISSAKHQALSLLQKETEHISISQRDWASQGATFLFVANRSPFDKDKYPPLNPVILMRLNYSCIIANNGFMSERYFDYNERRELETVPDAAHLRETSLWLHREAQRKYNQVARGADVFDTLSAAQVSGYINVENEVYYVSALPILPPDNSEPSNGTLVFTRRIDTRELDNLILSDEDIKTGELSISLILADFREIANYDLDEITYDAGAHRVSVASVVPSLDDSNILLEVSLKRSMFDKGMQLVRVASILIFLCSCALSGALLLTAEIWLVRPITTLAREVVKVNLEHPFFELPRFRSRELDGLSGAISRMLKQIDTHRNYIEEQNATLSERNRQLNTLANYDALTKLPNKNMFRDTLNRAIHEANNKKRVVAVMYLDVINFRLINDARGHAIGDQVLIAIANRLTLAFEIAESNVVASFGRDNFAVMITGENREEIMMSAYAMLSIFDEPFLIDEHEILVNVGVGIALYPFDGNTFEELDAGATIAMNNARETNSNSSFVFFNHKQLEDVIKRYNRIDEIKRGIERGEFHVVFQPKLDVRTNLITSSEALVRWHTPSGVIPPNAFIPDACRTGLIVPLTWEIMRQTLIHNKRFIEVLGTEVSVGINVPNNVLLHSDFISVLTDLLSKTQLPPHGLNVELTEDVLVNDMEKCTKRMIALQKIGVQISLDDFGTGYSSLQYLSRMPFNWMKIDKAFVDGLPDRQEEMAIIAASVGIARGLGMKVVLEGVETEKQWEIISSEHYCDEIQGYVVSKPLSPENFVSFVKEWNENVRNASGNVFQRR